MNEVVSLPRAQETGAGSGAGRESVAPYVTAYLTHVNSRTYIAQSLLATSRQTARERLNEMQTREEKQMKKDRIVGKKIGKMNKLLMDFCLHYTYTNQLGAVAVCVCARAPSVPALFAKLRRETVAEQIALNCMHISQAKPYATRKLLFFSCCVRYIICFVWVYYYYYVGRWRWRCCLTGVDNFLFLCTCDLFCTFFSFFFCSSFRKIETHRQFRCILAVVMGTPSDARVV